MSATPRHGWSYSLAAGLVALAIYAALATAGPRPADWRFGAAIVASAVLAARLGGWLAILSGGRDHGCRATAYAAVLFCVLVAIALLFLGDQRLGGGHDNLGWAEVEGFWASCLFLLKYVPLMSFLVAVFAGGPILFGCIFGALAFHGVLKLLAAAGYLRPTSRSTPPSLH